MTLLDFDGNGTRKSRVTLWGDLGHNTDSGHRITRPNVRHCVFTMKFYRWLDLGIRFQAINYVQLATTVYGMNWLQSWDCGATGYSVSHHLIHFHCNFVTTYWSQFTTVIVQNLWYDQDVQMKGLYQFYSHPRGIDRSLVETTANYIFWVWWPTI